MISLVIPLWNEERAMPALAARLGELRRACDFELELVLVNDGSSDGTSREAQALTSGFAHWKLVELSRNFGQQAAYRAGLDHATGDAIVFMDADLQDPPEIIPEMVQRWRDGARVVIAQRKSRADSGLRGFLLKRFHTVFALLTHGAMAKDSGTFGLMDRRVADHLRALPEVNLFLPALRSWFGYRHETVWYHRAARADRPKQTLRSLFAYAWDGITSFSEMPLKMIGLAGLVISVCCFVYAAVLIAIKIAQLFGYFPEFVAIGFTTLAVAILFMGGVQLLCLGIIGEYIARTYKEAKRRPIYIVDRVVESSGAE